MAQYIGTNISLGGKKIKSMKAVAIRKNGVKQNVVVNSSPRDAGREDDFLFVRSRKTRTKKVMMYISRISNAGIPETGVVS